LELRSCAAQAALGRRAAAVQGPEEGVRGGHGGGQAGFDEEVGEISSMSYVGAWQFARETKEWTLSSLPKACLADDDGGRSYYGDFADVLG